MINEPSLAPRDFGWIEVICGGMFSGKTEELIRRAKRAHIAGQNVVVVKPAIDKRYSDKEVVSHNENAQNRRFFFSTKIYRYGLIPELR